ncbi:MAG: acyl-CoA carboxylase epsilon subunit [Acidimicrobiia bacterium]
MSDPATRPALRVIDANATDEEVAAIMAALTVVLASGASAASESEASSRWVGASRLAARRRGLSRGEWRLSGRIGRRARA